MRETRLFDYGNSRESERFARADIVFATAELDEVGFACGTWAGLVNDAIAWRVEEGKALVFENIVTRSGLRLNLSSSITCRPLIRAQTVDDSKIVEVLFSCYTTKVGCILLRIRVTIPSVSSWTAITFDEVSRQALPATCITCMTDVDGDTVLGRADGSCALVHFPANAQARMTVIPFAPQGTTNTENRGSGEDTSMVSGISDESAPSHRSVASSISFGLMTRLFGSPRGNSNATRVHAMEATSHEHGQLFSGARRSREEKVSYKRTMDNVLGVAKVKLERKALISLHQSGRLCVYTATNTSYQFMADIVLPVKLSVGLVNHFILTGPNESVIAVVMADEDPNADSLRLFNVAAKMRGERLITLSATQIAVRLGPVDRIASASFTGEDVIVGSETGFVSGVLNVPSDLDDGTGIPSGTLWTALDDIEQPFGFANVLDRACPSPKYQLLQAHRFSVNAIAKALRLEEPGSISRAEIEKTVKNTFYDQDGDGMWKRVKARAEQVMKSEDLIVRDMCLVEGVGVVVARKRSLFVLRGLLKAEQKAVENRAHLLLNKEPIRRAHVGWMLSSHAVCQVIAAQYGLENSNEEAKSKLKFMLSTATSFSGVEKDFPLTDRFARRRAQGLQDETMPFTDLNTAIQMSLSALEPGPSLLLFLQSSSETEQLLVAAEQAGNSLPVSSMFASGIAWLSKSKETSVALRDVAMDVDSRGDEKSPEETASMLEKAFAFFTEASGYCTSGTELSEDDILCAIGLAGLTIEQILPVEQSGVEEDVIMVGAPDNLSDKVHGALFVHHLGFWLLERSVRMLESSSAASIAAAAAVEAMKIAPDRKRYEMMRAAAFTRCLDSENLESALNAILVQPYGKDKDPDAIAQESAALRDAIGLFVDATADAQSLHWLAGIPLPEPVGTLCGLALERRARAADVMNVRHDLRIQSPGDVGDPLIERRNAENPQSKLAEANESKKPVCAYEQLYSWHIVRGDMASAATSALEWGERLTCEGLAIIRNAISNQSLKPSVDQQLKLLLSWTRAKCEAWAYSLSAAQLEPIDRRYIVRSRFSLLADDQKPRRGIVDESWVSRRHLLAHAQSRVLTEMMSAGESDSARSQFVPFLVSPDSVLLSTQRDGLGWVSSMLAMQPSYDNMLVCAELGSAWREEVGEGLLLDVLKRAASLASQQAITNFGYPELDELLRAVVSTGGEVECSRNWHLIALESALSTSAGAVASPQWLIDAAAWGSAAFAEGTTETERYFSGRKRGDAAGVVRTLLRNHRPVDAAKLLIVGLTSQGMKTDGNVNKERFYIPYSAIDATMEILAQIAGEYPDAEAYRERLEVCTSTHISKMGERMQNNGESMEVIAS